MDRFSSQLRADMDWYLASTYKVEWERQHSIKTFFQYIFYLHV